MLYFRGAADLNIVGPFRHFWRVVDLSFSTLRAEKKKHPRETPANLD